MATIRRGHITVRGVRPSCLCYSSLSKKNSEETLYVLANSIVKYPSSVFVVCSSLHIFPTIEEKGSKTISRDKAMLRTSVQATLIISMLFTRKSMQTVSEHSR